MAKVSKISQDLISCGGIDGARTIGLAITRTSTTTCSIKCDERITKAISLKPITLR